jgi:hypothetical protein
VRSTVLEQMCYFFVFPFRFNIEMEQLLLFFFIFGTKPKQKEFFVQISEQNGKFAFVLKKLKQNQSKRN